MKANTPSGVVSQTLLPLVCAGLLLGAFSARAASVGAGGYTNDFSTPPAAVDFSTVLITGGSADITTAPGLDAAVAALLAANLTSSLPNTAAVPPAPIATAAYNGTDHNLQTQPSNSKMYVFMGTFLNNAGGNASSIEVHFDLLQSSIVAEQVEGLRVYYSLTGASNSWANVPELSATAAGVVSATVLLSAPWNVGSPLYLLFADENGSPIPDTINQLDNFSIAVSGFAPQLPVTIASSPTNRSVTVGQPATFTVGVSGNAPFTFQWYRGASLISDATNASYTLASAQLSDTGAQFSVVAANVADSVAYTATSSVATLTVSALAVQFGTNTLGPRIDISGPKARLTAIADVDGDGRLDVVTINWQVNTFSVYRNIGTNGSLGAASFAPGVEFPTGNYPHGLTVADIDGDGKPDVLVANYYTETLSVFRNLSTNGGVAFATAANFPAPGKPRSVSVADIDGDGKLDVAVGINDSPSTLLYRNTSTSGVIGAQSLAAPVTVPGVGPLNAAFLADVNGDGKPELVAGGDVGGSGRVVVYENLSTSGTITVNSFGAPVVFPVGYAPALLTVADLDGDGRADIISPSQTENTISVLRNAGAGGTITSNSFAAKVDFPVGAYPYGVTASDLDGDGKLDLIVANLSGSSISLLHNVSTSGTINSSAFENQVVFATGPGPSHAVVGDLNGDSKPDLVVPQFTGSGFSIFENLVFAPSAPTIATQPQGATVPVGANVTMSVTANGGAPYSYQWHFNNSPLTDKTNSTLPLVGVQLEQSGDYTVTVTNPLGTTNSQVATLTVYIPRTLALQAQPPAQEGLRVQIPVTLASTGDIAGMTFTINYDTNYLRDLQFGWDALIQTGFNQENQATPGLISASFVLAENIPGGTQALATLDFLLRSVPTSNLDTLLTVTLIDTSDSSGNPISTSTTVAQGAVQRILVRKIIGDNNANDRLDVGDATVILRFLASLDPVRAWDTTGNDVNQNASLDSGDVTKVLRAAAGIDPQPPVPPGASKNRLGAATAPAQLFQPAGQYVLTPDRTNGLPGQQITVQVRLQNNATPVSATAFTLNYPTNALRLLNSSSYHLGSMVPGGTLAQWNVAPSNSFAAQNGHITLAASSASVWPSSNGILADFTFTIQAGAPGQYQWPLTVTAAETTASGFDNHLFPTAAATFIGRIPIAGQLGSVVRLAGGQFQFSLTGDAGGTYVVDASADLVGWTPLQTNAVPAGGSLVVQDPLTGQPHRFYRVRSLY